MIDIQKRIFITGVTGFIGASLLHRLVAMGATDIHILMRHNSDTWRIRDIIDKVTVHTFSLEQREETLENIRLIHPQIIYHIAATGTAVGRAPFSIDELIHANTLGMIHLVDAANEVGCECFVNTGSSSEYGTKDFPMKEDDIIEPNNLYGLSKAFSTQYATYIGHIKKFPIVTYRLFSVYGPLEDPNRLIPALVSSYLNEVAPSLSSPHSVRDFIYIDDVIDSFLEADHAVLFPGEIFNIGTGVQSSIQEVINLFKKEAGSDITPQYGALNAHQIEPIAWVSDNSKMKNILGIYPIGLSDGIVKMIDYKLKN